MGSHHGRFPVIERFWFEENGIRYRYLFDVVQKAASDKGLNVASGKPDFHSNAGSNPGNSIVMRAGVGITFCNGL